MVLYKFYMEYNQFVYRLELFQEDDGKYILIFHNLINFLGIFKVLLKKFLLPYYFQSLIYCFDHQDYNMIDFHFLIYNCFNNLFCFINNLYVNYYQNVNYDKVNNFLMNEFLPFNHGFKFNIQVNINYDKSLF